MPQLNPSPWFMTLIMTWTTLLLLIKPTLMRLHHSTAPATNPPHKTTTAWTWTWH